MTQTLFIGLDGATFTLFDAFTREQPGEGVVMPHLARLMRAGFQAPLRSTRHPLTPPAWTTMMTGRSPGNHGIFDFVRVEDRGQDCLWTLASASDNRCETIWSIASRQGKRVVSLNFPMMSPPESLDNGAIVSGFVSWKHLRRNMTPPGLYDRIKAIPGFDAKELAWDFKREDQIGDDMSVADLEAWVHAHRLREEQWFKVAETMLAEDKPDLFAVMFDGTDKLQHQLWHVLEPALQPAAPSADHKRLRELTLGYYRRLDDYIGRLVEIVGPRAQVFIASDHGFAGTAQVVRINRYLGELGYLTWAVDDGSEEAKRRVDVNFAFLDWEKTKAFCPTPSSNGIRIRVAKEPGQPGIAPHEYDAFRDKLIADLQALRGPRGEKIITHVMTREDAFPGPAMDEAPDLTLMLNDFGFVSVRDKTPVVAARAYPAGTHHPDGIFIAAGPGIARDETRELVQLIDVPSILLHSVGLAVPADFEGDVPRHLFTADEWAAHPLQAGEAAHAVDREVADGPTDAEREKILEQMRALGYLDA